MTKILKQAKRWLAKRNRYARTFNELSMLTDRELGDIGITRCDIPRISKEGVR